MPFGSRLKEARINKKMTQEQLGEQVGVAKSTIAGYEKGTSHPDEAKIIKLMNALCVDANFLWQDDLAIEEEAFSFSFLEQNHLKKYRTLDDRGKENVDTILEKEYQYILKQRESHPEPKEEYIPNTIAAHNDGEITEAHNRDFQFGLNKANEKNS